MAGIDSYTKLMLHCNGEDTSQTFTDSAITPKTVTAVGTAQIDTAQSKFGGASGMLDGDSDYLSIPDSSDFALGSGNFTIDWWMRIKTLPDGIDYIWSHQDSATNYFQIYIQNQFAGIWYRLFRIQVATDGATICNISCDFAPSVDTWYHMAIVREGATTLKMYVNGVSQTLNVYSALSGAFPDCTNNVGIGWDRYNAGSFFDGWIDEFRVSKGIARWTANFDVPTAEYTLDGGQMTTNKGFWGA